MKRLLISCLIVCGCGNTANLPGASSHSTGDTNSTSNTTTNSNNPSTVNNGVDTCQSHFVTSFDDNGNPLCEVTQECQNPDKPGTAPQIVQGPEFVNGPCPTSSSSSSVVP